MIKLLTAWRPNQDQVAAAVRWLLTIAGSWAVQKGWVDDSQVTMIVGIAAAFVPLIWSFIIKTEAAKLDAALEVAHKLPKPEDE